MGSRNMHFRCLYRKEIKGFWKEIKGFWIGFLRKKGG